MADKPINDEEIESEDQPDSQTEITVRDAIAEVRRTIFGKEEVSQDRIRIRPFISNPSTVSVKAGFTKNLGNYESARVDVMLTMPCYPEEVDEIYEEVKDWVDSRIDYLYKEIDGDNKGA